MKMRFGCRVKTRKFGRIRRGLVTPSGFDSPSRSTSFNGGD